jgi:hypothetical protein
MQGYYADPSRRGNELNANSYNGGGLPVDSEWDYRGNLTYWSLVADGVFGMNDLIDVVEVDYLGNASYFRIPFDKFKTVQIPTNDVSDKISESRATSNVQSFYLTLEEVGALYQDSLENWESLNDDQHLSYCGLHSTNSDTSEYYDATTAGCNNANQLKDMPVLQIGEGVVSYPFYTTPYFYTPRKFVGRIYVESIECPTFSPTTAPSDAPSSNSTTSPSLPISQPASSLTPTDSYIDAIPNGCHRFISTDAEYSNFTNTTSASYGIIFPVQTNDEDADGVWVTSLGFHVDFNQLVSFSPDDDGTIDYEVYKLREEGYYADPDRNSDGTPQDYDYRGNFTQWKLVASGTVSKSFLSFYSYNNNQGESEVGTHFYQIPWDRFEPTYIPSNGDVQSFYLTLNSGSLVYRELSQKQSIGKIQKDDNYQRNYEGPSHPPFLLIGEVVIGYPFNTMPFLYTPKQFVGKIYYQIECPSENPSISPSEPPSISLHPSPMLTFQPSEAPTRVSSETPSFQPSISMKPHSTINSSTTASSLTNSWRLLIQWFMLGLLSIKIAVGS